MSASSSSDNRAESAAELVVAPGQVSGMLEFGGVERERLTHYMLRYPAKFHPPVARTLIERFSDKEDRVFDPFCGSGTTLVEATILGRDSAGTDIDPLAVFATRVKTRVYDIDRLRAACKIMLKRLEDHHRDPAEYERMMFEDIDEKALHEEREKGLWIPPIPNVTHWFRKYAIVDLARILNEIEEADLTGTDRDFMRLCFASTIRGASNADPVPVSGLEVTAHMKRLNKKGRLIDPFVLFSRALRRALKDVEAYAHRRQPVQAHVAQADATELRSQLSPDMRKEGFDVVITSPPYNNAVDYYRRHQLEMFWLRLVDTHQDRLQMKHQYIGRDGVRVKDAASLDEADLGPSALRWETRMREVSVKRANAFRSYVVAMRRSFEEMAAVLRSAGRAVCVVGHSRWKGEEIPTADLLEEAAGPVFEREETLWYPIKNHYMSYTLHNDARIEKEYVLVLRKRK